MSTPKELREKAEKLKGMEPGSSKLSLGEQIGGFLASSSNPSQTDWLKTGMIGVTALFLGVAGSNFGWVAGLATAGLGAGLAALAAKPIQDFFSSGDSTPARAPFTNPPLKSPHANLAQARNVTTGENQTLALPTYDLSATPKLTKPLAEMRQEIEVLREGVARSNPATDDAERNNARTRSLLTSLIEDTQQRRADLESIIRGAAPAKETDAALDKKLEALGLNTEDRKKWHVSSYADKMLKLKEQLEALDKENSPATDAWNEYGKTVMLSDAAEAQRQAKNDSGKLSAMRQVEEAKKWEQKSADEKREFVETHAPLDRKAAADKGINITDIFPDHAYMSPLGGKKDEKKPLTPEEKAAQTWMDWALDKGINLATTVGGGAWIPTKLGAQDLLDSGSAFSRMNAALGRDKVDKAEVAQLLEERLMDENLSAKTRATVETSLKGVRAELALDKKADYLAHEQKRDRILDQAGIVAEAITKHTDALAANLERSSKGGLFVIEENRDKDQKLVSARVTKDKREYSIAPMLDNGDTAYQVEEKESHRKMEVSLPKNVSLAASEALTNATGKLNQEIAAAPKPVDAIVPKDKVEAAAKGSAGVAVNTTPARPPSPADTDKVPGLHTSAKSAPDSKTAGVQTGI